MTLEQPSIVAQDLTVAVATPDSFAPFGTLIAPRHDGGDFGPDDARLDLSQGTPRFYVMRLESKPLVVRRITRHRLVSQCLVSLDCAPWFIAVAPPRGLDHFAAEPDPAEIRAFSIPLRHAIKLHRGTWHAGPLFAGGDMAFANLELADTNEIDHQTCDLTKRFGVELRLVR